MIDIIKYIILGFVQGVTEVLPISSSAHLAFVSLLLGIDLNNNFLTIILHVASSIALVIYLRKEILEICKDFFLYIINKNRSEHIIGFKLVLFLFISTVPLVIFTLILRLFNIEINSIYLVGILLCINGILLFIFGKLDGNKTFNDFSVIDALVIGICECFGIFTGISRSGTCFIGCHLRKIEKETAAKYTFLLFLPAVLGALILKLITIKTYAFNCSELPLYLISFIITLVCTYFSFTLLKRIIEKGRINYFGLYCVIMGILMFLYGIR